MSPKHVVALYYDAWISKRGYMSAVPLVPHTGKLSAPNSTSSARRFLAPAAPSTPAP
jgi:hypothetical protein